MQVQHKLAQAIELHKAGKIQEAHKIYNQILPLCQNNSNFAQVLSVAYNDVGGFYWDNGDINIALDCYSKAIRLNGHNFEALNNLGMLYSSLNNPEEAVKCYEKALKINPNISEIHNNLGSVYFDAGEIEKAIKCHEQAIKLKPDFAEAHFNLANAHLGNRKCRQLSKEPESLNKAFACYSRAIELKPDFGVAYVNLGMAYHYKKEPEKELLCYQKAEQLCPNSSEILNNIANMHRDAGRITEALEYFERAIQLDPNNDDAYVTASITYLASKNFEKGWKYYERRLNDYAPFQQKLKKYVQPVWKGEPLDGKTIYVYWEQGFGDSINFCRYLPVLSSMGARVLFEPQKTLKCLFEHNDLKAEITEDPKEFDYHVPLMSVPGILGVNADNILSGGKYLCADPDLVKQYREKYFDNNDFKLGIVWQCGNTKHVDQFRSVPNLSYFYPLLKLDNIKIYSFQKGYGSDQLEDIPDDIEIISLGKEFKDFSHTAAALENLDLLISVDTAVPHLAGAMGKPVWVLLQTVPDFRWFFEGETTPWYYSYRLFRQTKANQWEDLIDKVFQELKCTI